MTPLLFIAAFCTYSLLAYWLKRILYPFDRELTPRPIAPWQRGQEHALIFSPDYWWAFRFKSRLSASVASTARAELLRSYVVRNNCANVLFSATLLACCLAAGSADPCSHTFRLLSAIALIRFLSRSYEITYAFGRDVLQRSPSATKLRKHARVRLALLSYLEIYLYSAAAYTGLPTVTWVPDAVTLALNVGTLTNVGYAFSGGTATPFLVNLVFVQVITTLSLVVLSLAAYLSRKDA